MSTLYNGTLSGMLEHAMERFGEKPFIIRDRDDPSVTYGEFARQTERFASWLRSHGVTRGDRVLILCQNRIEALVAAFASSQVGAIFVMLGNTMGISALTAVIGQCTPRVAIV